MDTLQRLEAAHRGRALEAEAATRSELGAERWADQRWLARHGGLLMRVQLTRLRPAIAGWARRGRQRASVSFAAVCLPAPSLVLLVCVNREGQ